MVTDQTGGTVTFKNYYGRCRGRPKHLSLVKTAPSTSSSTAAHPKVVDYDYAFPFGPTDPLILTRAMRQIYEEYPQFKSDMARSNIVKIFQSPITRSS